MQLEDLGEAVVWDIYADVLAKVKALYRDWGQFVTDAHSLNVVPVVQDSKVSSLFAKLQRELQFLLGRGGAQTYVIPSFCRRL